MCSVESPASGHRNARSVPVPRCLPVEQCGPEGAVAMGYAVTSWAISSVRFVRSGSGCPMGPASTSASAAGRRRSGCVRRAAGQGRL